MTASREERQKQYIAKMKEKSKMRRDADVLLKDMEQIINLKQEIDANGLIELKDRGDTLVTRMKELQMGVAGEYDVKFGAAYKSVQTLEKKAVSSSKKRKSKGKKGERASSQLDELASLREMAKDVVYPLPETRENKQKTRKPAPTRQDELASLREMAKDVVYPLPETRENKQKSRKPAPARQDELREMAKDVVFPAPEARKIVSDISKDWVKAEKVLNETYTTEESYRKMMEEFCDIIKGHIGTSENKSGKEYLQFYTDLKEFIAPYSKIVSSTFSDSEPRTFDQMDKNIYKNDAIWKNVTEASRNHTSFNSLLATEKGKTFYNEAVAAYKVKTGKDPIHPLSSSYVILPIQRMPRYRMLTEELEKSIPKEESMHNIVKDSLEEMKPKIFQINETMRAAGDTNLSLYVKAESEKRLEGFKDLKKMAFDSLISFLMAKGVTNTDSTIKILKSTLNKINDIKSDGTNDVTRIALINLMKTLNDIRIHENLHDSGMFHGLAPMSSLEKVLLSVDTKIHKSEIYKKLNEGNEIGIKIKDDLKTRHEENKMRVKAAKEGDEGEGSGEHPHRK